MKNRIIRVLRHIYTMGVADELDRLIVKSEGDRVAAGDPAQYGHLQECKLELPHYIKTSTGSIDTSGFKSFVVDGFSMLPEGISNGDVLLCTPVSIEKENVQGDLFVVIKVDEDYYKSKGKSLKFDYKLRKTLLHVSANEKVENIIENLQKFNDDILLPENQKNLRNKYEESTSYYKQDLMLSITYREGALRYSFHPLNLIEYQTVYVLRLVDNNWEVRKANHGRIELC